MLSSWHGMAITVVKSKQLWLAGQELCSSKPGKNPAVGGADALQDLSVI